MAYIKAVRKASPVLVELSGVSGCGKTTTALLLAAGMAGADGEVGMLDTENGRGSLLADEKIIKSSLPRGYKIDELTAPFSPKRYIEKIQEAEKEGISVLVIDSGSHEFEGVGGISEIAETAKTKWAAAKREHKRFLYHCLSSSMDIIFCFRGREKVKIIKGSSDVIELGVQPICEKNWQFDMTVRFHIEDRTHHAIVQKAPREIEDRFKQPRMLTKADGEMLREWKLRGFALDPNEQLQKRARGTAEDGMKTYTEFFTALSPAQKKVLIDSTHADNKRIAEKADIEAMADVPVVDSFPDDGRKGDRVTWEGKLYECEADGGNFIRVQSAVAA